MSVPWSDKGEKTTIEDEDELMIIDSEDSVLSTKNKRIKKSLTNSNITASQYADDSTQAAGAAPDDFRFNILSHILKTSYAYDENFTSVEGIHVSPDGLNFFLLDKSDGILYKFTLSLPWDLNSTIAADGSYDVSNEQPTPTGVTFSSDGKNMYIVGIGVGTINQYTLTTKWTISSGVTLTNTESVTQDTSNDGILVGEQQVDQVDYSDGENLKLNALSGVGTGGTIIGTFDDDELLHITFQNDGTGYVAGDFLQIEGLTSASFHNFTLLAANLEYNEWQDIVLDPTGTKLYLLGSVTDKVYQYSLSVANDLSTISYDSISLDVTAVSRGLEISPDGHKLYTIGATSPEQKYLSTPWNVSTSGDSVTITDISDGNAFRVSPDGSVIFILNNLDKLIEQHDLGIKTDGNVIAKEVETSSLTITEAVTFEDNSTQTQGSNPENFNRFPSTSILSDELDPTTVDIHVENVGQMQWKPDGTKLFVIDRVNSVLYQFSITATTGIPFDMSTFDSATVQTFEPGEVAAGKLSGFFISTDGLKLYLIDDDTTESIIEYTLSSEWDIETDPTATGKTLEFSVLDRPQSVIFHPLGTKFFITDLLAATVTQFDMTINWDISTAPVGGTKSVSVASKETVPLALAFSPDGNSFFTGGNTEMDVFRFDIPTAWDLEDAQFVDFLNSSGEAVDGLHDVFLSPKGDKIYITAGMPTNKIFEYSLGIKTDGNVIAGGVETPALNATVENALRFTGDTTQTQGALPQAFRGELTNRVLAASQSFTDVTGLAANPEGTILVIAGNDLILSKSLTTPWDLSAIGDLTSTAFTGVDGLYISPDGTHMYVTGVNGAAVVTHYLLTTSWDPSTATEQESFTTGATTAADVSFRPDGKKMYVTTATSRVVFQYDVSSAWDFSVDPTLDSTSTTVVTVGNAVYGIDFSDDGNFLYLAISTKDIYRYHLVTPWETGDISSTPTESLGTISSNNAPHGLLIQPNLGSFFYGDTGIDDDKIYQEYMGLSINGQTHVNNIISSGSVTVADNVQVTGTIIGLDEVRVSGVLRSIPELLDFTSNTATPTAITNIYIVPDLTANGTLVLPAGLLSHPGAIITLMRFLEENDPRTVTISIDTSTINGANTIDTQFSEYTSIRFMVYNDELAEISEHTP